MRKRPHLSKRDTIISMRPLFELAGLTWSGILFWTYAAILGGAVLISFVLFYHWVRYNPGIVSTVIIMAVYSVGTAALLLSLFGVIAQL